MQKPKTTGSISEDLKVFRNSKRKRKFDFYGLLTALIIVAGLSAIFFFEYRMLGYLPNGLDAPLIRVAIIAFSTAFAGWTIYRAVTRKR